jgi:hypothetical protein
MAGAAVLGEREGANFATRSGVSITSVKRHHFFERKKVAHIARELNLSRQTVYEVLNGR